MGIPTKVTSFRLRDGSLREIGELQDVFAPAFKTRTSMVEWLIALGHTIFVRHQGEEILRQAQRLLCITPSFPSEASVSTGAELDAGVARPSLDNDRSRVLIQLKSTAIRLRFGRYRAATAVQEVAWGTSFRGHRERLFAGAQS